MRMKKKNYFLLKSNSVNSMCVVRYDMASMCARKAFAKIRARPQKNSELLSGFGARTSGDFVDDDDDDGGNSEYAYMFVCECVCVYVCSIYKLRVQHTNSTYVWRSRRR